MKNFLWISVFDGVVSVFLLIYDGCKNFVQITKQFLGKLRHGTQERDTNGENRNYGLVEGRRE